MGLPCHSPHSVLLTGLVLLLVCRALLLRDAVQADVTRRTSALGLRRLAVWNSAQPPTLTARELRARLAAGDAGIGRARADQRRRQARAVVDVDTRRQNFGWRLSARRLTALGAEIFAQAPVAADAAGAVLSARLPLAEAGAAARLPGVFSISLVRRAHHWIGKATTQGRRRAQGQTRSTRRGYDGTGITGRRHLGQLRCRDRWIRSATPLTDHASDRRGHRRPARPRQSIRPPHAGRRAGRR